MTNVLRHLAVATLSAVATGCSSSSAPSVSHDGAAPPDTAPEAAPAAVCQGRRASPTAGGPCGCDNDCEPSEVCFTEGPTSMREDYGAPGGSCLRSCAAASDCADGFDCVFLVPNDPGTGTCFARCTVTADCRLGYVCESFGSQATYCNGLCQADSDCAATGVCNRSFGLCAAPDGSGAGRVGDACARNEDCASEYCLPTPSFPGGSCTAPCSLTRQGCPAGSACAIPAAPTGDEGWCFATCASDADCRSGYACRASLFNSSIVACVR
jgi:hypothetical protein